MKYIRKMKDQFTGRSAQNSHLKCQKLTLLHQ